jgi:Putative regulator of cell autolysis
MQYKFVRQKGRFVEYISLKHLNIIPLLNSKIIIMSLISKEPLLTTKGVFAFFLVGVYIVVVTNALPYGIIPSMVISLMAPISVFLIAYPTYFIMLPKLMKNKGKKAYKYYYILASILLIVSVMVVVWLCLSLLYNLFDLPWGGLMERYSQLKFLNPPLFVLTYFFSCVLFVHNCHHDYMNNIANEKIELEMKALKSQINTHFLHNALNNIYSMIYFEDKEDAAKYVMKLSQMLRYVLDDCETDHVLITKEVTYIENYIDFQKARFDTDKDIRFNYIQHTTETVYIPPMIFQPLIENCFKYCPLEKEGNSVRIELEANNGRIRFVCENTQNKIEQSSEKKSTGIGLENLNKRLQIFYKDNYSLNISDKEDSFRVELIINS